MSRIMSRPIIPGQKPDRLVRPAGNLWAEGSGGSTDRPQLSTLRRSPQRSVASREEAAVAPPPELQTAATVGRGLAAHVRAPRLNAASVGRQETVAAQILEENKLALASLVATRRTGSSNSRHMSPMSRVATSHRPAASEEDGRDGYAHVTPESSLQKGAPSQLSGDGGLAVSPAAVSLAGQAPRSVSAPKTRGGDRQLDRFADGGRAPTPQRLPNRAFLAVSSAFRAEQPSVAVTVPQPPDVDRRPSTPPERCVRSPYRSVDVSPLRRIDGPPRTCSPFRLTQLPLEIPELPHIARPARSSSPGFAQYDGPHHQRVVEAASLHKPSLSPARVDVADLVPSIPCLPVSRTPKVEPVAALVHNHAPEGDTLLSSQSSASSSPSVDRSRAPQSRAAPAAVATGARAPRADASPSHVSAGPPGVHVSSSTTVRPRTVLKFSFPSTTAALTRAVPEEVHRPAASEREPSVQEAHVAVSPPAPGALMPRFCWSCGSRHPDRSAVEHAIRFCCACGAKAVP